MKKKDLKAVLLASALCGAAVVSPVIADETEQDPVDLQDQVSETSKEDSDVMEKNDETVNADDSTGVTNEGDSELYSTQPTEMASQDSQKNGWEEGNQRYYENGVLVENQFKEIDGNTYYFGLYGYKTTGNLVLNGDYYCFDDNGIMKKDYFDGEYYHGSDGKQIENQWKYVNGYGRMYFDDNGNYYYAWSGEDGSEYYESYEIDGDFYLFDSNGVMQANKEYENKYYGSDGKSVRNTWVKLSGGYKYYDEEGNSYRDYTDGTQSPNFNLINGKLYHFDSNGYMITGWYKQADEWFYFNTDGTLASNKWIDDTYYVKEDGSMATNEWVDGSIYVDANGKKTKNTWERKDGKWKYKLGDGNYASSTILFIDGKYYAFDNEGYMVTNSTTWANVNNTGRYGYVHANASGQLITGWYEESDGTWSYYGDDYFAYESGLYTIGGKQYYFNSSVMASSSKFVHDGKLYEANASGVVTLVDTKGKTDWVKLGNSWYYFENGTAVTNAFKTIGGNKYYFTNDGTMICSQTFEHDDMYYYANSDGVVINKQNSWYQIEYGSWLYFKKDGTLVNDEIYTINNNKYYFNYSGYLQKGIISTNNGRYVTNNDGVIQFTKGWKYYNFEWYYAKADGTLYSDTFVEDGGNKYYFNYSGAMVNSDVLEIDDDYYYFDSNGVLKQTVKSFEGWKKINNQWYYRKDGDSYYTGKVGNNFVSAGKMCVNTIAYDADNYYYVDYNGNIQKGWIEWNGTFIYANPTTGVLAKDKWLKINNQWYYFSNIYMMKGNAFVDGAYNKFNASGVWQGTVKPNSWVYESDTKMWQYINEKGLINTKSKLKINGVTYYFYAVGKGAAGGYYGLVENGSWYDSSTQSYYWINKTGTGIDTTTGWKKSKDGYWAYVQNGKLVTGLKTINGTQYYFSYDGSLYPGVTNMNGKAFVVDSKGNAIKYKEGWNACDGQWFYIKNGVALTNTVIDGYYLGYDGFTKTGLVGLDNTSDRVVLIQGKLAKNQWVKYNNQWFYGDANGNITKNQWIGNYYVDNYGVMAKNAWIGNYHVGADGKWDRTK